MTAGPLLLVEGDRTCEECKGTGLDTEEMEDPGTGDRFEATVACEHCENGRITERQNPARIDLALWNEIGRDLILNERFRAAIKRRHCEGRGVKHDRFIIDFAGTGHAAFTMIASGPTIHLPNRLTGIRDTCEWLSWKCAPTDPMPFWRDFAGDREAEQEAQATPSP